MARLTGRRITVVGINYAPEPSGIAPYTTALARALSEAGAAVHVITGLPHYPQWAVNDPRFTVGSYFHDHDGDIRLTRCRHFVPSQPNLMGRLFLEATFLARALQVLIHDRSDVVLTVTPSLAGMAAGVLGRRGRPVGAVVQDLTANAAGETGGAKSWICSGIRRVEYGLLRRCRKVGVITPEFAAELTSAGVRHSALIDLPNFTHIDPIAMSTSEARAHLGWNPDRLTVVHTGNMGAKQGLLAVVEAARRSSERGLDIDFVLMGDGNQREVLACAAKEVASLHLMPPVSVDDYPIVLAAADLLLVSELPGVCQMSLPSKLTSYAAAGKPILAMVDPGGITARFLRGTELGLLLPAGDPGALVAAVAAVTRNEQQLTALAASSTRVFRSHYGKPGAYRRYVEFAAEVGGFRERLPAGRHAVQASAVPVPRSSGDNDQEALELAF